MYRFHLLYCIVFIVFKVNFRIVFINPRWMDTDLSFKMIRTIYRLPQEFAHIKETIIWSSNMKIQSFLNFLAKFSLSEIYCVTECSIIKLGILNPLSTLRKRNRVPTTLEIDRERERERMDNLRNHPTGNLRYDT